MVLAVALLLLLAAGRGVKIAVQHAERQAVAIHGKRQMKVQSRCLGSGLVVADDAETRARVEKFRSVPSWIARTVRWLRIRWMLLLRCGARIASTVIAVSSAFSMNR